LACFTSKDRDAGAPGRGPPRLVGLVQRIDHPFSNLVRYPLGPHILLVAEEVPCSLLRR